jgi:hypothetical protein
MAEKKGESASREEVEKYVQSKYGKEYTLEEVHKVEGLKNAVVGRIRTTNKKRSIYTDGSFECSDEAIAVFLKKGNSEITSAQICGFQEDTAPELHQSYGTEYRIRQAKYSPDTKTISIDAEREMKEGMGRTDSKNLSAEIEVLGLERLAVRKNTLGNKDLTARLPLMIISSIAFLSGIFFLSNNLTGNAIADFSTKTTSFLGAGLLIVGLVAGFFWIKSRKK